MCVCVFVCKINWWLLTKLRLSFQLAVSIKSHEIYHSHFFSTKQWILTCASCLQNSSICNIPCIQKTQVTWHLLTQVERPVEHTLKRRNSENMKEHTHKFKAANTGMWGRAMGGSVTWVRTSVKGAEGSIKQRLCGEWHLQGGWCWWCFLYGMDESDDETQIVIVQIVTAPATTTAGETSQMRGSSHLPKSLGKCQSCKRCDGVHWRHGPLTSGLPPWPTTHCKWLKRADKEMRLKGKLDDR